MNRDKYDITLMNYRFDNIFLEFNHDIPFKKFHDFPIHFEVAINMDEDNNPITDNVRIVDIKCSISDHTFNDGTSPIFLNITINGLFKLSESIIDDSYDSQMVLILYSHLRAFICTLTSQLGYNESIMLPIVDMKSFIINSNYEVDIADKTKTN